MASCAGVSQAPRGINGSYALRTGLVRRRQRLLALTCHDGLCRGENSSDRPEIRGTFPLRKRTAAVGSMETGNRPVRKPNIPPELNRTVGHGVFGHALVEPGHPDCPFHVRGVGSATIAGFREHRRCEDLRSFALNIDRNKPRRISGAASQLVHPQVAVGSGNLDHDSFGWQFHFSPDVQGRALDIVGDATEAGGDHADGKCAKSARGTVPRWPCDYPTLRCEPSDCRSE
jgi:hypothetical protein